VAVGGAAAKVAFSGLAPGYPWLYQINVTIPAAAAPGVQPLEVAINGIAAGTVYLPVQ
jgi:uncharacterized protein (TIGR03437 family)